MIESMSQIVTTLAAAVPAGGAPGQQPPGWFQLLSSFGPILLIFAVFWWFITSAKKKQERERTSMLEALKKGDRIEMIGGEVGSIVETKDDRVLLKVDESTNTKIWYKRSAISGKVVEKA